MNTLHGRRCDLDMGTAQSITSCLSRKVCQVFCVLKTTHTLNYMVSRMYNTNIWQSAVAATVSQEVISPSCSGHRL